MRRATLLLLSVLVVIGIPLAMTGAPYMQGVGVYAVVLALFGLSVNLTVGYLGYISFGHAAFFGLGAYCSAMLTTNLGLNFWPTLLIAPIPAAALGVLVGFASLRVGGAYFAIATLTTAEILRILFSNLVDLTRGPMGIVVSRPKIGLLESLGAGFYQYYLGAALLILILVAIALNRLLSGPIGKAWAMIKESPDLAESAGIPTLRYRVMNIGLSGALAGLAGALLVPRILVVSPDVFSSGLSATGLLIAFLGGKATIIGPILGGLVFSAVPEALRFIDDYRIAIFAALLLFMIRVQPGGLVSLLPSVGWFKTSRKAATGGDISFPEARPLTVSNLSKRFGGLTAVDGVNLTISPGELVGLIGPNGAGKTTSLSMISGFEPPSGGEVRYGDEALTGIAPHRLVKRGVTRTFQQTAVCSTLTPFENVLAAVPHEETLISSLLRIGSYGERQTKRESQAAACLDLVGLSARADAETASLPYGEQKLLSVAIALATCPGILLLDEPAAGLNHTEARSLATLLGQLRDRGLTIVIVDHNLKMIMALCDRIYVLDGGKPLADGRPDAIRQDRNVIEAYLGRSAAEETANA